MALTELYSGNNTANTTEWSLTTNTAGPDSDTNNGVIQPFIDVSDMIAGDQLQIRIYEKVRSGGTQRLVYESILTGPQSSPIWTAPSLMLRNGWDVTVKVLAGTTIIVDWSLRSAS